MSEDREVHAYVQRIAEMVNLKMAARMIVKEEGTNETARLWAQHYERDVGYLLRLMAGWETEGKDG